MLLELIEALEVLFIDRSVVGGSEGDIGLDPGSPFIDRALNLKDN